VEKAALSMEKCNVIRVTLAFSRKKASNHERAGEVRAEEEERRTVSFIILYFKMNSF
jgi:hypothetical protein